MLHNVLRSQKQSDSSSPFMLHTHLHNNDMVTRARLYDSRTIKFVKEAFRPADISH